MLFGDGRVELVITPRARQLLARQKQQAEQKKGAL
jgi:hypothetical protein